MSNTTSCPPKDLLDLLYTIPFPVRRNDIVELSHHNNVKYILIEWMICNFIDQFEPQIYKMAEDIPEVTTDDIVSPKEWNSVLDVLKAIDKVLDKYVDPSNEARQAYSRYVRMLKEAESGQTISSGQYNTRWNTLLYLISICIYIDVISHFSIYVTDTEVWKYWDYLMLPDGSRVSIPAGKYYKIFSYRPFSFGIEEMTEEIGESPDWDFNEPKITVLSLTSLRPPHGSLRIEWEAVYHNILYYDGQQLLDMPSGTGSTEITI
jgi:hypothetical protein